MKLKYRIREDLSMIIDGVTVYRIEALRPISRFDIEKGELGGYVEKQHNLSQYGSCWIMDDAKVWGDAQVQQNASVLNTAKVYGSAIIKGSAEVYGNADVYGHATIYDHAQVHGNAKVSGRAVVFGTAELGMFASVAGFTRLRNATVYEVCRHGPKGLPSNALKVMIDSNLTAYARQSGITREKAVELCQELLATLTNQNVIW
jgi:carbonic anhydrase/acetyltransferase-like protein (isoleucine patch superfamily)